MPYTLYPYPKLYTLNPKGDAPAAQIHAAPRPRSIPGGHRVDDAGVNLNPKR
jgi:hypothetical protein